MSDKLLVLSALTSEIIKFLAEKCSQYFYTEKQLFFWQTESNKAQLTLVSEIQPQFSVSLTISRLNTTLWVTAIQKFFLLYPVACGVHYTTAMGAKVSPELCWQCSVL